MPRDLITVINQILPLIPEVEEYGFKHELEQILYRVGYTAPEVMNDRWRETSRLINLEIPQPPQKLEDWQQKIVDIWMDKLER